MGRGRSHRGRAPDAPRRALLTLVVRGLSNKAIAREMAISENTVKYCMKNIPRKLGAQNRMEAATQTLRPGIVQIDPASPTRS